VYTTWRWSKEKGPKHVVIKHIVKHNTIIFVVFWLIVIVCILLMVVIMVIVNNANNNRGLAATLLLSEGCCSKLCCPTRPTGHWSLRDVGPVLFADGVTMQTGTCFPRNLITVKKWRHYKWPLLINGAEAETRNWSDNEKFDSSNSLIAICN